MVGVSVRVDEADVAETRQPLKFDDMVAFAMSAGLAVIALPFTYFPSTTPRMVVVLCALPLGLAALTSAVRRGDRCSVVGLGFVLWALVCAVMSDGPWVSVFGAYGHDTSAFIVAAAFGVWAMGRRLSDAGRRVLPQLLLACFLISA